MPLVGHEGDDPLPGDYGNAQDKDTFSFGVVVNTSDVSAFEVDIMEINPILDIQNRTAQMAVNLISSLFGKKIL